MNTQHLLLAAFWIIYCALHSGLASLWWKARMQRLMGTSFRYYRLWYTLFAFATLVAVVWYQVSIPTSYLFSPNLISKFLGGLLLLSGIMVMTICIRKYFLHLSGLKSLYQNEDQAANQLQISGIHRFVRHPLYSGTFMAIWGLWILVPQLSLFVANTIITVYTVLAISWEEQKLVQEFGEAYQRYQKQVPRLIPFSRKISGSEF